MSFGIDQPTDWPKDAQCQRRRLQEDVPVEFRPGLDDIPELKCQLRLLAPGHHISHIRRKVHESIR